MARQIERMKNMKIVDLEKQVSLIDYASAYGLQSVGNETYRINPCPICGGMDHFTLKRKDGNEFYNNFAQCGEFNGGGLYRFLQDVEKLSAEQAYRKLHEMAGVTMTSGRNLDWDDVIGTNDGVFKIESASTQPRVEAQIQSNSKLDLTEYILELHKRALKKYPLEMKEHFLERGISINEIMDYKLSVFKDKDGLRTMLPVWKDGKVVYYITRAIEGQEPRYKNAKGSVQFFNSHYLDNPSDEPIFVTEGIIDALSLEYFGFKAIAMNSADNADKLKEMIRASGRLDDSVFISATDTDTAGIKAADILGFPTLNIPEPFKDVNEWLVDSIKNANEASTDSLKIESDIKDQIEGLKQPDAISSYLEHGMLKDIDDLKPFRNKKTGFDNLDSEMKGLYAGLYVVGGISSVGKTTFVHQLSDQLAEQGDHVIYFSLEQSKLEMVSKSLSRTTAKLNINAAVPSVFIRNGNQSEVVKDAIQKYKKVAGRVNVIEGNFNTNVDTIRKYVARYKQLNKVNPVVVVDYLQIMPAANDRMNDKQKIDYNVTELKRLSRDFRIPVFVISSLNRSNYLAPIDFESFKESGKQFCHAI